MIFQIKPLEGIYWDNKSIRFGDTKDKVKDVLVEDEIYDNIHYYFNNELSIHFDQNNKVEFMEFLGGLNGNIQPIIYEKLAFKILEDELYNLILSNNIESIDDEENGYSFIFKNISVGIYRESTPMCLDEMIEEMKNDGIDINNNEEIQIEKEKALYWSTLGIGCKDYYC